MSRDGFVGTTDGYNELTAVVRASKLALVKDGAMLGHGPVEMGDSG